MFKRRHFLALASAAAVVRPTHAQTPAAWADTLAQARGKPVFFNAWGGDERTNAFIEWTATRLRAEFAVDLRHVRLRDTAEAVQRVIAEKAAGRDAGGAVDLVWINGPNFVAMKERGLLHGPFAQDLPNFRYVDTLAKPSTVVDFTVPVEGYAAPWRMAQIVYVYDEARLKDPPRTIPALLAWALANPGRTTHPAVRNFLGTTFLKQALFELAPDAAVLQREAGDAYAASVGPLWRWYDALRPALWRQGRQFPDSGPAQRQLLNDGEIDLMVSFNPAEAAVSIANDLLPKTARVTTMQAGSIGNTSFVAIPYNAANRQAAAVAANFLMGAEAQARMSDPRQLGNPSVLDIARLPADARRFFAAIPPIAGMPTPEELGRVLPEPHPSWMTRIAADWERRYTG